MLVTHRGVCVGGCLWVCVQVDMWAVGVTTFYMLFGCHPYACKADSPDWNAVLSDISAAHQTPVTALIAREAQKGDKGDKGDRGGTKSGSQEFPSPEGTPEGSSSQSVEGSSSAGVSRDAVHFLTSLLRLDPSQRLTAEGALAHPWIQAHAYMDVHVDVHANGGATSAAADGSNGAHVPVGSNGHDGDRDNGGHIPSCMSAPNLAVADMSTLQVRSPLTRFLLSHSPP